MRISIKSSLSLVCCWTLLSPGAAGTAWAGGSWFSEVRTVGAASLPTTEGSFAAALVGDSSETVFDVVVSLYNDPPGDDDPSNDMVDEQQAKYEEIIRFWADSVCEQTNEATKLGKVRLFRNGIQGSLADVVWNEEEWPRASLSGFGRNGRRITFGDIFPEGCGSGCDFDYLADSDTREDAGYTLGHEWGHYVLGVADEYVGSDPDEERILFPQTGDTPVTPSIMNSQWNATPDEDFEWLNHSTSDNYEANTAQGRVYGASAWEILIQETSEDPRDGDRSDLPQRVRYAALVGEEPDAGDDWVQIELPDARNDCRDQLEIIWMQDDIEIQIVFDRSDSMAGTPIANAQEAAKNLVGEVEDGKTALGVVAFNDNVDQTQPIVAIPDPPGSTKTDIQDAIDGLDATGRTAIFDAADLALTNLQSYASTNATDAAQLVFLLSDGIDNSSAETQAGVTTAYQNADVPLITLAYGSFAPEGVLRELADDTGGFFRASPTDLNQVQSTLLAAKAAFTSSAGLLQETRNAPGSGSTDFDFDVDSTLKDVAVFANYLGDLADISFSLISPGGPVALPLTCNEVGGATSCSGVIDPATPTGLWTLRANNNTGSAIAVNVDLLATPLPVRTFDVTVSSLDRSLVQYPEPIVITATVSQGLPITGVAISATVTTPSGTTTPFTMFDTGDNGDGIADDGTYSAILDYTENGIHTIEVKIDNASLSARFTGEGLQPAHPTANQMGMLPMPPSLPPILESFTRTASAQITVDGVLADDHPDSAPGTPVAPNNTDVPGRIDFVGDPDVFSVPTAGFDHMVFRVTGLALGMETHLRLFEEDGMTEITSATIDQLVPSAAYVALHVPVKSNATIHAEVTHASAGTGTYAFSAGNRIVSDPPLVAIDIKPDSEENPINPFAKGKIPVVILGSEALDVGLVEEESLGFGPSGAPGTHPKGGVFKSDFDEDGLTDYLNHYRTPETGIGFGDTEACLSGTIDGVPFSACDTIRTVGGGAACGLGAELALLLPLGLALRRARRRFAKN